MCKRSILLFIFGVSFLCASQSRAQDNSLPGKEIIQNMHDRYQDSWYTYLTFDQETITYKNGEVAETQRWFEALELPGKLVIKFDSLGSGSGLIFRNDSLYVFQQNELTQKSSRVHDLLVLGFDVYGQPVAETVEKLTIGGFDFTKTYETQWQGRPVYVVGASDKDDESPQFWIDKERLYFVRMFRKNPQNGSVQETQFNNYEKAGGGWVSAVVVFSSGGELRTKEVYSNIVVHKELDASIFDVEDFENAVW